MGNANGFYPIRNFKKQKTKEQVTTRVLMSDKSRAGYELHFQVLA
jgi:hypothetical protein